MTTDPQHIHNHQLVGADADAIDALVDAKFDLARVPESLRARAGQAASVMALLDGAEAPLSEALIDVTMARLARIANPIVETDALLSPDDSEALDAYVAADFRTSKVPASLRPRAQQLEHIGSLLVAGPESSNALLVERTMRAVATTGRPRHEALPARSAGFRFADLVSVAAVLLMGVAVAWPVLSTAKTYSIKSDCATNMAGIASAFGRYTNDYRDQLPMASASFGGSWVDVGTTPDRSNSANLYTLARTGYAPLEQLACKGNPMACGGPCEPGATDWKALPEVSYSYYIMFGDQRPTPVSNPQSIILTDKSPVVLRAAISKDPIPFPGENSPNHAGQGQYALRADGSAAWLSSPQVGRDNIWLSRQQELAWDAIQPHLTEIRRRLPKDAGTLIIRVEGFQNFEFDGGELPSDPTDTLVGP